MHHAGSGPEGTHRAVIDHLVSGVKAGTRGHMHLPAAPAHIPPHLPLLQPSSLRHLESVDEPSPTEASPVSSQSLKWLGCVLQT